MIKCLDYFLISKSLTSKVINLDIKAGIKSDHEMILSSIAQDGYARGPGLWKPNCSILKDEEYRKAINELISIILNDTGDMTDTCKVVIV